MPDVFLPSLDSREPRAKLLLERALGIKAYGRDGDLVIPNEMSEKLASRSAFKISSQMKLADDQIDQIAARLVSLVPAELRTYAFDQPSQVNISKDYGILSELDRLTTALWMLNSETEQRKCIADILRTMKSDLKAQYVTCVSPDVGDVQASITVTKMLMLSDKFGVDGAQQMSQQHVLSGIVPSAVELVGFVDVLTRFTPHYFTLPVHFRGCSWHFQTSSIWQLPFAPSNGLGAIFSLGLNPLASASHLSSLRGLSDMNEAEVWRLLCFMVRGANRVLGFANDFRPFASEDGRIDLLRKTQAYGALFLIFADLHAMHSSTQAHSKISFAMSILDKLANLKCQVGRSTKTDQEAFKGFASKANWQYLKTLIGGAFRSMNYADLGSKFEQVIDICFANVRSSLESRSGMPESEEHMLRRLGSQRNLRHGTFLDRNQFETVFLDSSGIVSDAIGVLAFVNVLALLSDPKAFLAFAPKFEN